MSETELSYIAAVTLGLLGSSHCLVMCGGIAAALGMGSPQVRPLPTLLLFQLGRIGSYTTLALLLAGVVSVITAPGGAIIALPRLASALLLIAMGLYISSWWNGLLWLERVGKGLWQRVQPFTQKHLPVQRYRDALVVGLCWGLLPCGLIYTALAWSATAGSVLQAAALMACFGLGTLPAMLITGAAGQNLQKLLIKKQLRNTAALLLIGFGVWTAWGAVAHLRHSGHGGHAMPASETSEPGNHHGHH